ncbi:MAG: quinolinate synthase NadA [Candidatus Omnitrophica bacterium]|nr:quinolinate synthase NadA [Candidatus Omnitrophota bacterium]
MFGHKFNDEAYRRDLVDKIQKLKKAKNAVIIAHNYQREEVQKIADYHGDSLALAQTAVRTDASIIVFCGVHFMAESAAILNPNKKVLLPVLEAGCPLADMVTVDKLREAKAKHKGAVTVCYVNTSADVKAESDICCTSSNAVRVVRSLREKEVIFIPDKNLGRYVQSQVPDKKIILWEGFCQTHLRLSEHDVKAAMARYPGAEFIAHPECDPEVLAHAAAILSTAGMFKHVKKSSKNEFIIGTELGILYRLQVENPEKKFYSPTPHLLCAHMKLTTLGWVLHALENEIHVIKVDPDIAERAKKTLERMLEVCQETKEQVLGDGT